MAEVIIRRMKAMPYAHCYVRAIRHYNGDCELQLYSYNSYVCAVELTSADYHADEPRLTIDLDKDVWYSTTTARHINRFTTECCGENLYHSFKHHRQNGCVGYTITTHAALNAFIDAFIYYWRA